MRLAPLLLILSYLASIGPVLRLCGICWWTVCLYRPVEWACVVPTVQEGLEIYLDLWGV